MDRTKRTVDKKIYVSIAIIILITGAIISYFYKNHTPTTALQKKIAVITKPVVITTKSVTQPDTTVKKTEQITKATRFKTSIIYRNLQQAAVNAGLTTKMIHQLNAMFANGSIARNLRPGDRLEVLYHEYFVNNHRDHPGHIIAAEIVGKNKSYKVVRFEAPHRAAAYYQANGQGTKPEFLKIPLHYVRIGSYFSYHRMDPVLHKVHPHLGVDFDAPKGTPVKAIGNGVVLFCKQMRGYGNVVMIQYNRTYKTLYAHLEKFAMHLHPREHVTKGQIVGYVGATGWATGPHLHFSLYKNGVAINPLTVHFPNSSPIPAQYRRAFFNEEARWFDEMKLFEMADNIQNQKTPAHTKYAENRKK